MRLARAHFLISVLAFACTLVLVSGRALAAGSITFAQKDIPEVNGGWHLAMTIIYGGKPPMPHVPMRFAFTPTAFYESYLDDKHGDKPQKRTIPLVSQLPINESVDVGFSDPRGKIFDRTKFEFTISRAHNFAAGEYSVKVTRSDGATLGAPFTIKLQGDNPVIDRRAISFVDSSGKKKPAAATEQPAAAATAEANASAPAAEGAPSAASSEAAPASSSEPPAEGAAADPTDAAKVPPSSRGCGCRTVGGSSSASASSALVALIGAALWRGQRRRRAARPLA